MRRRAIDRATKQTLAGAAASFPTDRMLDGWPHPNVRAIRHSRLLERDTGNLETEHPNARRTVLLTQVGGQPAHGFGRREPAGFDRRGSTGASRLHTDGERGTGRWRGDAYMLGPSDSEDRQPLRLQRLASVGHSGGARFANASGKRSAAASVANERGTERSGRGRERVATSLLGARAASGASQIHELTLVRSGRRLRNPARAVLLAG